MHITEKLYGVFALLFHLEGKVCIRFHTTSPPEMRITMPKTTTCIQQMLCSIKYFVDIREELKKETKNEVLTLVHLFRIQLDKLQFQSLKLVLEQNYTFFSHVQLYHFLFTHGAYFSTSRALEYRTQPFTCVQKYRTLIFLSGNQLLFLRAVLRSLQLLEISQFYIQVDQHSYDLKNNSYSEVCTSGLGIRSFDERCFLLKLYYDTLGATGTKEPPLKLSLCPGECSDIAQEH